MIPKENRSDYILHYPILISGAVYPGVPIPEMELFEFFKAKGETYPKSHSLRIGNPSFS